MLRLLCLVACFFFVVNVLGAEKYIRVIGAGSSIEQAKENAFRTAVQQRAGAIVLSERQSTAGTLTKDNISLFSAGYVDDFKIIDINQNGSNIRITLDVLVADSKIYNQVLNTGQSNQSFQGERAVAALNTFIEQKQKGDGLLDAVLGTYPQNAFIVSQKPYVLTVDSNRNATLNIPYTLKWNYAFIASMNEAMSLIEDKMSLIGLITKPISNVTIMAKNPKDILFGEKNSYNFNDKPLLDNIKNSMRGDREVRIMLEIFDNSNILLYHTCYVPDSVNGRKNPFYRAGDPGMLIIYGNEHESGELRATIDPTHNYVIQRASKLEVSVIPEEKCHW